MLEEKQKKTFASILSDGTIRIKCAEDDPKAVKRDYELSDGTSGTKFERVYGSITGRITAIEFYDGNFGESLNITLSDEDNHIVLSMSSSSSFAEDIMKRLPNVNMMDSVKITPYSFEDKKTGKNCKGVTIMRGEDKVKNFFVNEDGKTAANGYPALPEDTSSWKTNDWKIYFMTANKFLSEYTIKNIIPNVDAINGKAVVMEEPEF